MKSVFLCENAETVRKVYDPETVEALKKEAGLADGCFDRAAVLAHPEAFAETEAIFSTWGMPQFTEDEIRRCFPKLRQVFYAAGTVQSFARPFLACGVRVHSAWAANAVPVAEYTVSQILLANKGFFSTAREMSRGNLAECYAAKDRYPGNYGATVGIIGAGMVGKQVIRLLKPYHLPVKVFDPFLPEETAQALGVTKCGLAELFADCQVVSNHLANNAQTRGMLNRPLFASMKPYATFLNTGRGAQVVEADLAAVLAERPDLTAILDVTDPEPPQAGHPFYALPNCILTPHIAGSSGDEVHRMAAYMLEEYRRTAAGEPGQYAVSLKMLETMA